jgi:hypothetical protein
MPAQTRGRVDRRIAQALQVPALDQEDVIDEGAHGREPPPGLHFDLQRFRVRDKPRPPLVALFLRVTHQFIKG